MKYIIILLLYSFATFGQQSGELSLRILNSSIQDGHYIDVQIRNISDQNYAIVVDTAFYKKGQLVSYGEFKNLTVSLYEKTGTEVKAYTTVKSHGPIEHEESSIAYYRKNDTLQLDEAAYLRNFYRNGYVSTVSFIKLKAGSTLTYKIPFNLVIKYLQSDNLFYYDIDKRKRYKARIEHIVSEEFIAKYFRQYEVDLIEAEGYKIFHGNLVSNKVPLILK